MDKKERIKRIITFSEPMEREEFILDKEDKNIIFDIRKERKKEKHYISGNYEYDLEFIKKIFSFPKNNDVVIREITIFKKTRAFLVFYDGMVDTDMTDLAIIKPLLEIPQYAKELKKEDIAQRLVAHSQVSQETEFEKLTDNVNFGDCGLIVEGIDVAFSLDVRKWEHRGVEKPETEQSLFGPQEAYSEMLRGNSALIRKTLKTEKLICEGIKIGKESKTRGVLMYISDIANEELIKEVKNRINSIAVDYIVAIEEVALLIENNSFLITEKILSTERPDRTARMLAEGRVALLLNGSSKALIFPTNAFELMHAASDAYMRYPYANMTRILRILAMLITLLLPGMYLAITLYHQEMIPTFLAYAISAARESVPFPSVIELLIMDASFELIREAGIRMPSVIGSTLGIVGGLILGQAAVSAKIVSPLMIIIIAITGIGSFAIPNYSLGWSYRILRLIFILLAAAMGFFGVAVGIFIYSVLLGAETSFGVPFLAPLSENKKGDKGHSIFVKPIWKNEKRPSYLKVKRENQEPKISRKWKKKKK